MEEAQRASAERVRSRLESGGVAPAVFRAELARVPAHDRDTWLDCVLRLDVIPEDGPELPRGCTPYLPCPAGALLGVVEHARVGISDVFVDIGSGVGKAAAVVQLCTGASVIGLEIQPELVHASRELARRLSLQRFSTLEGDAVELAARVPRASVFFLYCPFSGQRLDGLLDELEVIARTRRIRVCCVDVPLPDRYWLTPLPCSVKGLTVHESTLASEVRVTS